MNWGRRKKLWMGKRKLHVSDSVSQCLKCFCVRLVHFYVSDCPRRRIVSAGTNFEPLNPKLIVYCPKRQIRGDLLSQTRPDLHHHPRRGGEEQMWRGGSGEWWLCNWGWSLDLISRPPLQTPNLVVQSRLGSGIIAERNRVFLPLQPLRSNRQNFHAQTPRPQTSLSNAGLVDVWSHRRNQYSLPHPPIKHTFAKKLNQRANSFPKPWLSKSGCRLSEDSMGW